MLLVFVACARGPGAEHDPRPSRVIPSDGLSTGPVSVVIEGENFLALATQQLGGGAPLDVDSRFEVRLGDTRLEDVVLEDERHLRAVVPAGLETGWHSLTVVSPLGRRAVLPNAYFSTDRIRVPAELRARVSLSAERVSVGQEVSVELEVHNTGQTLARAVTATADAPVGFRLLATPEPVDIPSGEQRSFVWRFRAEEAGSGVFTLSASGTEALTGQEVRAGPLDTPPITVPRPAALTASLDASPGRVNVGNSVKVSLTVTNPGETAARAVTPSALTVIGAATLVSGPTPASRDLAGGEVGVFEWEYTTGPEGTLSFKGSATGQDDNSGAVLSTPEVGTGSVTVQRPAQLVGMPPAPSRLNVGQTVTLSLQVANLGTSTALAVTPSVVGLSASGLVEAVGEVDPPSTDIPGGETRGFRRTVKGTAEGTLRASIGASGTDAVDGRPVSMAAVDVSIEVQRPAALTASMAAPATVSVGTPFFLTLTVTNTGGANATGVTPDSLSCTDTAGLVVRGTPSGAGGTLAGGRSTTFSWELSATRPGTFRCSSVARGLDANDARAVASALATSNTGAAQEVTPLAENPFGDGTAFSYVFRYDGRIYLGPSRTGRGGVRMAPDGSSPESFSWLLPADTTGNRTSNARPPPYLSIGATGCAKDSYDCGPDNENGRGLFFAGVLGGQEWLGVAGANTAGDLDHLYLTQERDAQLDFRFVDLAAAPLGGQTKGVSSALFFGDRLYLGFPDTGGNRPYLVVLKKPPSVAPGLDASPPGDAEELDADKMPWVGRSGVPANLAAMQMIDAITAFNDRLYLANNGGCMRSTTPTPRSYDVFPGDWAVCTPSLTAYTSQASRTTSKTADLEPADKAVPGMAVFGGRLYLARNTTVGPQLFVCAPDTGGDPAQCDPGDWSLVAPNTRLDLNRQLTQFDNPANASLSLLVATEKHLYLGFDDTAEGVVLLRSEGLTPSSQADFRGTGGCLASQHGAGGCGGLGGNGLAGTRSSRLFDGVALTFGGADFVYVTAGDGSAPVRVFRVTD